MARFTRRARLLKAGEFQAVFKQGRRINAHPLIAVTLNNTLEHARIGFAVAKKAVPLATQRNRLKRKIRDQFRNRQDVLAAVDVVILARPGCGELTTQELDQRLERLWTRLAASQPNR